MKAIKTICSGLLAVIILTALNSCVSRPAAEKANIVMVKGFLNNVVSGGQIDKLTIIGQKTWFGIMAMTR